MSSTVVYLVGQTGVGKSALANFLLENSDFGVGHSFNSCTKEVQGVSGDWFGKPDLGQLTVKDVPGMNDTRGPTQDEINAELLVSDIRRQGTINAIVVVLEASNIRMTKPQQALIHGLVSSFGAAGLEHLAFAVTKVNFTPTELQMRETENGCELLDHLQKQLQQGLILMRNALDTPLTNSAIGSLCQRLFVLDSRLKERCSDGSYTDTEIVMAKGQMNGFMSYCKMRPQFDTTNFKSLGHIHKDVAAAVEAHQEVMKRSEQVEAQLKAATAELQALEKQTQAAKQAAEQAAQNSASLSQQLKLVHDQAQRTEEQFRRQIADAKEEMRAAIEVEHQQQMELMQRQIDEARRQAEEARAREIDALDNVHVYVRKVTEKADEKESLGDVLASIIKPVVCIAKFLFGF